MTFGLTTACFKQRWQDTPAGDLALVRHPTTNALVLGLKGERAPIAPLPATHWFVLLEAENGQVLTSEELAETPAIVISSTYELVLAEITLEHKRHDMGYGRVYAVEHSAGSDVALLCWVGSSPEMANKRGVVLTGARKGLIVSPETSRFELGRVKVQRSNPGLSAAG